MKAMRFKYGVAVMCMILHVSKSGYYKWLNRKPSRRVLEEGRLEVEIKAAHKRTRETCVLRGCSMNSKTGGECRDLPDQTNQEEVADTMQAEEKVQGDN